MLQLTPQMRIYLAVLNSGKQVYYDIESWHSTEDSSLDRENLLIGLALRNNPQLICNSNGERWKGKPSKALVDIRTKNNLCVHEFWFH
jgi:hypothetical protein